MEHGKMYYGASRDTLTRAAQLRSRLTESERLLWERLRNNQISGYKFRRQHPIASYVADFYCHKAKLVIEVDEIYHEQGRQRMSDGLRTKELEFLGLSVLRFSDRQVKENIELVVEAIRTHLPTFSQSGG